MTLVLACNEKIYSDRKITADTGERCENLVKCASNEFLVAGFAGDFETILEAIRLVESGEGDPKVIAKTGVEGLIVKDGRTLLLDCRKVWKRPKSEGFYSCGTGAYTAMAFISGRLSARKNAKLDEMTIKLAFKYTSKCRTDCGATFDVVG